MQSSLVSNSEHNAVLAAAMAFFDYSSERGETLSRYHPRLWVLNSGNAGSMYIAHLLTKNGIERVAHQFDPKINETSLEMDNEGVRYYLGDCSLEYVTSVLYFSRSTVTAECSNRLFSMADGLKLAFPNSQFVHLVRDNRTQLGRMLALTPEQMERQDYSRLRERRLRYSTKLAGPVGCSAFESGCWYWANYNERIYADVTKLGAPILRAPDLFGGDVSLFENFFNKSFKFKSIEKTNETPTVQASLAFDEWPDYFRELWQRICGPVAKKLGLV